MGGTRLRPVGEGGHIIEDEGIPLAQRPALNFLGDGVVAADSPGKTNVTIPGATPVPPFDFNETARLREEFDGALAQGVWYKQDQAFVEKSPGVIELNNAQAAFSSRSQFMIILTFGVIGADDKIGVTINNLTTLTYRQVGTKVKTGDVTVGVVDDQNVAQWGFVQTARQFDPNALVLRVFPSGVNGVCGFIEESYGRGRDYSKTAIGNSTTFGPFDNFQIFTQGGTLFNAPRATLWVMNMSDV